MHVALIRPGLGTLGSRKYSSLACFEPKAIEILGRLTPEHIEVTVIDDRFTDVPFDTQFDMVALSVGTYQARRAYEIGDRFRSRGTPVIMGGFHPTFVPGEAAAHADVVAIGEAEGAWPQILEDFQKNTLKKIYHSSTLPFRKYTQRSVLNKTKYLPMSVIQFTRGCAYNCDFCSVKAFYKGPPRTMGIEDTVREIVQAGRKTVFFVDDNLVANKARARELCHALMPLGIKWFSQVSLDFADDPTLVDLMARSGCRCAIVGLESLSDKNLCQMGKGWADARMYESRLKVIRDHGIMIYGCFVFGYDWDTSDTFKRTVDFALEQKLCLANFNNLNPFPGTRLYDRLKREGRLIYDKWWLDSDYEFGETVFHPATMTAKELTKQTTWARNYFHSYGSIARRFVDLKANLANPTNAAVFLATNLISRQDIMRKHGRRFTPMSIPKGAKA